MGGTRQPPHPMSILSPTPGRLRAISPEPGTGVYGAGGVTPVASLVQVDTAELLWARTR
jgi:hypothetical protein